MAQRKKRSTERQRYTLRDVYGLVEDIRAKFAELLEQMAGDDEHLRRRVEESRQRVAYRLEEPERAIATFSNRLGWVGRVMRELPAARSSCGSDYSDCVRDLKSLQESGAEEIEREELRKLGRRVDTLCSCVGVAARG